MLQQILKGLKKKEEGFTLIELLIVVAIIAILAAIAIPQFSAYRERGIRASMVADARNLATQEEAYFVDTASYGTIGVLTPTPVASKGNTIAATVIAGPPIGYSITVANAAAGVGKSPVTFWNTGVCSFADNVSC